MNGANCGMKLMTISCFLFSGNPDACDLTGNTALHLATIHGHIDCVSFLINFGVNLWSLNNDYQTAKDVTVRAHCDSRRAQELLILLDESMARALMVNPKSVTKQQDKALIEAEKRVKQFEKVQKKSLKKAEKEDKQLEKVRTKLIVTSNIVPGQTINGQTSGSDTNTKKAGKLFQANNSKVRNNTMIKSLSNISNPQLDTCCHGHDGTNDGGEEEEDSLEVVQDMNQTDLNVRGIMSEVLKRNRLKSAIDTLDIGSERFKMAKSKSGSTIQLFESKLAPKVTPKTFSQIVNSDRNSNYSNGLNYANYKSRIYTSSSSASSSVSSSWKGTISKLNKLTINTSLGAVSKRILHRKASTGSTNSAASNRSNQSNDGVVLKQLLIKSGSLNNLSTIYCSSDCSSPANCKERNGFTINGTTSSKSSFSSGNNNNSLNYSDEFKIIEKINQDSGIGCKNKVRPLSGVRSQLEPDQVLYVKKPSIESIDQRLINSKLINSHNLYMSHKSHDKHSLYHSMNSLSMKSEPWIEMFQKNTQL